MSKFLLHCLLSSLALNAWAQQTLPFTHQFSTPASLETFTIVDANADGLTWKYDASYQAAVSTYGDMSSANDWLISPALHLLPGETYRVEYDLRAYTNNGETFGIFLGQGVTPSALTTAIKPLTSYEVSVSSYMPVSQEFTVATEGDYNLGLQHATSSLFFGGRLYVQQMSVTKAGEAPVIVVPAAPSITLTIDSNNAPYAVSVAVKAPATGTQGETLTGLKQLDVMRDNTIIFSVNDPYVNATVRTTDENIPAGTHIYSAVAYALDGTKGETATSEVTLGEPEPAVVTPAVVTEVVATYDPASRKSTITWPAVTTDANGNALQGNVTYSIRRKGQDHAYTTTFTGTTYEDVIDLDGQVASAYYVAAINEAGKSAEKKSNDLMIGTPYELPFSESAPSGVLTYSWLIGRTGTSRWGASDLGTIAYDHDGGYVTFCPLNDYESSTFTSGHIRVDGSANPVLRFHYFYVWPSDDEFYVDLIPAGGSPVRIWNFDFEHDPTEEWNEVMIPINEFVPDAAYVQVVFGATLATATKTILYLDDISLIDRRDHDLGIKLVKAPRTFKPGEPRQATFSVGNLGSQSVSANAATVRAMANGHSIGETSVPSLAPGQSFSYTFQELNVSIFEQADSIAFQCEVVMADDEYADNNTTGLLMVDLKPVYVASPADVKIHETELFWSAPVQPAVSSETHTEDFELAPSFTISDFGEWSLWDATETSVYGLSDSNGDISFPHSCEPQAWTAIDYTSGYFNQTMQPHSGDKLMAAFSHPYIACDSWLISPELSGEAQTVSLYAKALTSAYTERFKIAYSNSASMDYADFVDLPQSRTTVTTTWTEYSFSLPAGARYFAVVCVSNNALCLLVDDVTYVPEVTGQPDTLVLGYNVYCDGEKVNDQLIADEVCQVSGGNHTYNVTAVYAAGESRPSTDAVYSEQAAITSLTVTSDEAVTYSLTGQRVSTHHRGLVIREGRKVMQ